MSIRGNDALYADEYQGLRYEVMFSDMVTNPGQPLYYAAVESPNHKGFRAVAGWFRLFDEAKREARKEIERLWQSYLMAA